MSQNLLVVLVAALILLALAAWPVMLGAVCPPCARFLRRRRQPQQAPVSLPETQADAA